MRTLLLTLALSSGAAAAQDAPAPLQVFILAGQSNMQGAGALRANPDRHGGAGSLEHLVRDEASAERYAHLVDENGDWVVRDDVWISYFEREGGLSVGYGSREDTIGPELGFGHVVGEALEADVLLIKVAWGGKSLAVDFRPPSAGGEVGLFYTQLFDQVRLVLGSLEERFPAYQGQGDELAGFGWHQGWNDRVNQAHNDAYEQNLAHFIRDLRTELEAPELPFVLAETGMSGHAETHPRAAWTATGIGTPREVARDHPSPWRSSCPRRSISPSVSACSSRSRSPRSRCGGCSAASRGARRSASTSCNTACVVRPRFRRCGTPA